MITRLMRGFSGGRAGPPEAPVWQQLERCGIDFRAPVAELLDRYPRLPIGWADDIDICLFEGCEPFLPGQSDPIGFDITAKTDLTAPPALLRCAVRERTDHRLNYAHAIARLVKLFGDGQEASTDAAVGRRWRFGRAEINCFVIPPERLKERPQSRRNLMFPDRATEASIHIAPGVGPADP